MSAKKKIITSLAVGLFVSLIFNYAGFAEKCEEVSGKVLRLHIVAASDSEEDQALKLKVRDMLLKSSADIFDGSVNVDNAVNLITPRLPELKCIAENVIRENGYNYKVSVSLKNEYFTTRRYDSFTMPPGEYKALRVVIGEGKGHNWWCVMYPSMCLPGAAAEDNAKSILGGKLYRFIGKNPQFEPRFKIIEIYESLKFKLGGRQSA